MKGLVLSLKPFKQKERNILLKSPQKPADSGSASQRRNTAGRGFFRDSSGKGPSYNAGDRFTEEEEFQYSQKNYGRTPDRAAADNEAGGVSMTLGSGKGRAAKEILDIDAMSSKISAIKAANDENCKKYGLSVLFAFVVLLGVIGGTVAASGVDMDLMGNLEFLMFMNIDSGSANAPLQVFSSAFAVNFIYLTIVFLVGLSPWGMGVIPFICLLKGFETGLIASYLGVTYTWGMTYYFLIVAPGVFLFAFSLIIQSGNGVRMSSALGRFMFSSGHESRWIKDNIKAYMYRSGSMMIMATAAALLNTFMWTICSGMFEL